MSDWAEGDADSNGVNVHFYRTGRGKKPALLMAHGFTDNGLCWTRVARALEASFDIVMVDARNHGRSGEGMATLRELAGDMAAVISHLQLDQPAAMGHSVGASIVAGLAAYFPQAISRIVLEDPPWTLEPQQQNDEKTRRRRDGFKAYVRSLSDQSHEQISENGRALNPTWHADDFPAWATAKQQVSAQAMDQLDLGDWTDTVPLIQCPALLIYAGTSGIVSPEMATRAEQVNKQFSSQQIADAGHNVRREQFDEYVQVAKAFLEA